MTKKQIAKQEYYTRFVWALTEKVENKKEGQDGKSIPRI